MSRNIILLDCTLRDGGLGLEDNAKCNSCVGFSDKSIDKLISYLCHSNIDIIELGSIDKITNIAKSKKYSIYKNIESISSLKPKGNDAQIYAALYRGPDIPLASIPEYEKGLCELARVILRYSELKKSLEFCRGLANKGYKVCIQPMLTMRYNKDEINYIVSEANHMQAYALYIVDSYGYMNKHDIYNIFQLYQENLDSDIKIGFHAHNNLTSAYSNAIDFIEIDTDRDLIIDSCIMGMGQGAGNLQTEVIVPYLIDNKYGNYNYEDILNACEEIEKYTLHPLWGYSVERLVAAVCKTAYKYASSLRNNHHLSYAQIYRILKNIPDDLRHRYTEDNTKELIKINKNIL